MGLTALVLFAGKGRGPCTILRDLEIFALENRDLAVLYKCATYKRLLGVDGARENPGVRRGLSAGGGSLLNGAEEIGGHLLVVKVATGH